jgi:hypothetical protein
MDTTDKSVKKDKTKKKKEKKEKKERKTRKSVMDNLKTEYIENKCEDNMYSNKCNEIALQKEEIEIQDAGIDPTTIMLYPTLNDPNFSRKIFNKKEFNDTRYDGEIFEDVKAHSNKLIGDNFRVLQPHQSFVKNFLSFQTPFNSLLLFHGLGSGKTCSAIGVCEESRDYLKQTGSNKKMCIIASPNVLDNFKKQLFDETNLKQNEKGGEWSITSCIGNKFIDEINPTNLKGLTKEHVILQIKNLIKTHYVFMGYIEFANYINEIAGPNQDIKKIKNEFNDRLLVIDEIHNIRNDGDKNKVVADNLLFLIRTADRMRLLLLSATPMFNSCTEIIWLLNLLNINDRRPTIDIKKVFNEDGDLIENGDNLLIRKMRGYISYVRGENPYTFPFRIFPKDIIGMNVYTSAVSLQMNGRKIETHERTTLDLYSNPIGIEQLKGYAKIMDELKKTRTQVQKKNGGEYTTPHFSEYETIPYPMLKGPLQALNIIYPTGNKMDEKINILEFYGQESSSLSSSSSSSGISGSTSYNDSDEEEHSSQSKTASTSESTSESTTESTSASTAVGGGFNLNMTGELGLKNVVSVSDGKYAYTTKYQGFFAPDNIGKYSSKIKIICEHIIKSIGIVLVYSQYIDGGLIPMALALEEIGFNNISGSLFNPILKGKLAGKYAMITGDTLNSKEIVNKLTDIRNKDGSSLKVILISKTGSEGIDLKYIRQIHIMEPWYNMSRIEQIIGRGVRNGSHQSLPFEERNVEIYMHSTIIPDTPELELADEYLYRQAEVNAKRIGVISKLMKENAVDCILNQEQLNFTEDNFPNKIRLELSSGGVIDDFQVGDKDYTSQCDYDKCIVPTELDTNINLDTYNIKFAIEGSQYIISAVKSLMLERHFYTADTLMLEINRIGKGFSEEQIYVSLTKMITDNTIIYDKYKKKGTLVNVGNYYLFQPEEITNKNITTFERMVPIPQKPAVIAIKMNEIAPDLAPPPVMSDNNGLKLIQELNEKYDNIITSATKKAIRGEKEWDIICGSAMHLLVSMDLISSAETVDLLVNYLVDYSTFNQIVDMCNYLFSENASVVDEDTFKGKVFTHIQTKIFNVSKTHNIYMYDKTVPKIAVLDKDTKIWEIVDDKYTLSETQKVVKKKCETYILNSIIGFIDYDKVDGYAFKMKDLSNTRNNGSKCANAGKLKTIKLINQLIGEETFTTEIAKSISQPILCIIQEFLVRHYNNTRPDKKWFMLYEEYMTTV